MISSLADKPTNQEKAPPGNSNQLQPTSTNLNQLQSTSTNFNQFHSTQYQQRTHQWMSLHPAPGSLRGAFVGVTLPSAQVMDRHVPGVFIIVACATRGSARSRSSAAVDVMWDCHGSVVIPPDFTGSDGWLRMVTFNDPQVFIAGRCGEKHLLIYFIQLNNYSYSCYNPGFLQSVRGITPTN